MKLALMEIGLTILVASTIGFFLTEAYQILRELTISNEIFGIVDRLNEIISKPGEFKMFKLYTHLDRAGVLAFYPDRLGPAQEDIKERLLEPLKETQPTTIYLLGDTLRVFFGGEGPFTHTLHQIIVKNPNVLFKVLLLNPNCDLALCRSEAETAGKPFKSDEEYRHGAMFSDSKRSSDQILDWNLKYASQRDGIQPIQLRFYDYADYCFGVIFPDVCYIAQYMLADAEAQVQTPRLPLLKYKSDSFTYKRFFWHFNRVWENSSLNYEELIQFMEKQPVVARRLQRLNTSKNSDR